MTAAFHRVEPLRGFSASVAELAKLSPGDRQATIAHALGASPSRHFWRLMVEKFSVVFADEGELPR